jgi:hypothetical protein
MYYMWINKNLVHQVGDQTKVILRSTVNQPSRFAPTCFGPYLRPSSGGSRAVFYAVTELNSVDVLSLCSCIVCGRMSLSSVVCVCVCVCVCVRVCLEFLSWWNLVIQTLWLYDEISPGKELQAHMTRFHQDRNSRHTWQDFTRTGTPGTHTQPTIMTYGRILYKNITNVHPRNST